MELNLRKQRILSAIVQDYVATAEPVGSQILVDRYALGVKSATVRSEMAEMSEQGYLHQPHTSAGRVPSDRGYRFYVNRLMVVPPLRHSEARRMQATVQSTTSELEAILKKTCQLLAQMTRLPAMATPPDAAQTTLGQIFLSQASSERVLIVLLYSSGRTQNRVLPGVRLDTGAALALANTLNECFRGRSLGELRGIDRSGDALPPGLGLPAGLWHRLVREIAAAARDLSEDSPVFVEGAQTVLAQPEFRDVERLAQFLSMLQERGALLDLIGAVDTTDTVSVRIGEEMGRPGYAVVVSRYEVAGRERGTIGVVGPTRMDYAHASRAVGFMARTVGETLTRLAMA
jgi:heat-inducible transcriptional repressor